MLFTFDTTHHALWAEEIARGLLLACEVVPAPPDSGAKCHLALEVLPGDVAATETALQQAGVPFEIYGAP
ncbi:MAG TPA: DUF3343 domain-containing protein [Longimicrobiaceae bacterium]|nr:DUF3343 domain-containing protein [Longimicrobiaceae bacterium]